MNYDHNSVFRMNHVGFLPGSKKVFVIDSPPGEMFQVYGGCREKLIFQLVYEGKLQSAESEVPGKWYGDFSHITKPANYYIKCGGDSRSSAGQVAPAAHLNSCQCGERQSRSFIINNTIYDVPARVIFNFFTWQRCGHELGWAGKCHLEDGVIMETGEHLDFSGGHHQSCDLRKSIDGVSIGIIGLIQYALLESPHWDRGCIADEIKWSTDYFRKLIHPDGYMRDGLFVEAKALADWGARYYYNSPAAPSEQWHSIRLQALAARYFRKHGDAQAAAQCLDAARRVWTYMVSDKRRAEPYHAPIPPPYGLGRINEFYTQVYKDSAADISFRLCAAADLFRVTGEDAFRDEVVSCANRFSEMQLSDEDIAKNPAAACFREAAGRQNIAGNACGYAWVTVGPSSLCEALELVPENPGAGKWKQCLEKVAQQYSSIASRNVWQRIPNIWVTENGLTESWLTWRQIKKEHLHQCGYFPEKNNNVPCYYIYGESTGLIVSQALFLLKASRIFNEPEYLGLAQRQVDLVFGANPYDASCVTGVGYNQLPLPMWTLSPPIPQIPGGVSCGLSRTEYEIPVAGQFMRLLAEIKLTSP